MRPVEVQRRARGPLARRVRLPRAERAEHLVHEVLRRQPLDQLDLRQPRGRQVRGRAQQLDLLGREAPARARAAGQHAEAIVARDDGGHQDPAALLARPQTVGERPPGHAVGPVAVEHVEQQALALHAPPHARLLGRARGHQLEVAARRLVAVQAAGVGGHQVARAARDRLVELLTAGLGGERLGQPRELGQRVDTAAGRPVELGVLDRARHERRGVDEEVHDRLVELARGDGVQHDHPDDVAGPADQRHGDHRLEVVLVELGDVVVARVLERVVADQHRLARARDPAADPLADAEPRPADEVAMDRRRGPQHEPLVLDQVHQAGVAVRRLAQDPDDVVEDLLALERRGDRRDHGIEERVLLADPYVRGEFWRDVDYRPDPSGGYVSPSTPGGPEVWPEGPLSDLFRRGTIRSGACSGSRWRRGVPTEEVDARELRVGPGPEPG